MKRAVLCLLCVLATAAVVVGCSSDEPTGPAVEERSLGPETGPEDGPVIEEPGPIQLAVGDRATIRLESNVTTGYQWGPLSGPDPAVVRIVTTNYRPAESDRAGAPGTQDIVLEGVAPGTSVLELGYARPWEQGEPPARTASYTITVG
jgi:predicted secreted protein